MCKLYIFFNIFIIEFHYKKRRRKLNNDLSQILCLSNIPKHRSPSSRSYASSLINCWSFSKNYSTYQISLASLPSCLRIVVKEETEKFAKFLSYVC